MSSSTASSSSSSTSSSASSSSSFSMPKAPFAKTDASIRNFYRTSISSEVLNFSLFTSDHLQRSESNVAANCISEFAKTTLEKMNQQQKYDRENIDNDEEASCDDENDNQDEEKVYNNNNQKNNNRQESRRFTKYTELVIHVLTQIYQSFNKSDSCEDKQSCEGFRQPSHNNFYLDLDIKDLEVIFSMCVRTIAFLIIINKSVLSDFTSSLSSSNNNNQKKKNLFKQRSSSFWFEIPNWKNRKVAKTKQLQRIAFISRQVDSELTKFDQQEEEEEEEEKTSKKRTRDFPDCGEFLEDLKQFYNKEREAEQEEEEKAVFVNPGLERRSVLKKGLKAVVHLEAVASSEDFWSPPTSTDGMEIKKRKKQKGDDSKRRRRDDDNDDNDDEGANENSNIFEDSCGTLWTSSLREGCGLLGGISQFIRGLILQMEYEVKRTNEEFDLMPGTVPPLINPQGWMSRFQPLQGKFYPSDDGNNSIKYWFHVSFENKRVGIKERLLPDINIAVADDYANETNNNNIEAKKERQVHFDDNKDDEVSSNENDAGDDNDADDVENRRNGEDDDDADLLPKQQKSANKPKRKSSSQPLLPNTRTLHTCEDENFFTPAPLPTILSRLINDRSLARHKVHTSYEKIISLMEQIKDEVANFSAASEAANILEKLAPEFLNSTQKDLAKLKTFSQILQAACVIATVSPRFFFEFDSRRWEREVLRVLGCL